MIHTRRVLSCEGVKNLQWKSRLSSSLPSVFLIPKKRQQQAINLTRLMIIKHRSAAKTFTNQKEVSTGSGLIVKSREVMFFFPVWNVVCNLTRQSPLVCLNCCVTWATIEAADLLKTAFSHNDGEFLTTKKKKHKQKKSPGQLSPLFLLTCD